MKAVGQQNCVDYVLAVSILGGIRCNACCIECPYANDKGCAQT